MLNLNYNSRWRLDVGAMNFSICGGVGNLAAFLREKVLPRAMPVCLVLPPRITISASSVRPMMQNAWAALRNHFSTTGGANATAAREGFVTYGIDNRVLQACAPIWVAQYPAQR